MEMDKLGVITTFIHNIVVYNIPLLYGTVGEIVVEKSGSLNLGVEGIMAVGAIFGYIIGCYTNSMLVGILTAFAFIVGCLAPVYLGAVQGDGTSIEAFGWGISSMGIFFLVGGLLIAAAAKYTFLKECYEE